MDQFSSFSDESLNLSEVRSVRNKCKKVFVHKKIIQEDNFAGGKRITKLKVNGNKTLRLHFQESENLE